MFPEVPIVFEMLKSKCTKPLNIEFSIYQNLGILIHVDSGLDPPPPLWTNMDILGTPLPPQPSTWFVDDPYGSTIL